MDASPARSRHDVADAWAVHASHPRGFRSTAPAESRTREPAPLMSRLRGKLNRPAPVRGDAVFNEAATVEEIIRRVVAVPLQHAVLNRGDDCSTERHARDPCRLQPSWASRCCCSRRNGQGAALRTGFGSVRGDLVVIQDADLEYSPEEFPGSSS